MVAKVQNTKNNECKDLAQGIQKYITGFLRCHSQKEKKRCKPIGLTWRLWGAHSASNPQISKNLLAETAVLAVFAFFQEVLDEMDGHKHWGWLLTAENIAKVTPSASTFHNWRISLAVDNLLLMRPPAEKYGYVIQNDGGPTGQEIVIMGIYNGEQEEIQQNWLGTASACGKSSKDVAKAIKNQLKKVFGSAEIPKMLGLTSDSGAGTPESLGRALENLGLFDFQTACTDSCGLHDTTSIVRLALQNCVGDPGLDKENTLQLLHIIFTVHKLLWEQSLWDVICNTVWE